MKLANPIKEIKLTGTKPVSITITEISELVELLSVINRSLLRDAQDEGTFRTFDEVFPGVPNTTPVLEKMDLLGKWFGQITRFSPLVNEVILCRAVDIYLRYVTDLLTLIFIAKPETLKSNAEVTFEFVLQHKTIEDLILSLTERKVNELAYKSLADLEKFTTDRFGFPLFDNETQRLLAVRLVETRNLITHSGGIVNKQFKKRLPDSNETIGDKLVESSLEGSLNIAILGQLAEELDKRAIAKFGLQTEEYNLKLRTPVAPA
jgi:hypothetical protein